MLTIFLVRHGETSYNKNDVCQGQSDIPLNETGKNSAILLGKKFKNNRIVIDYFYSSPLSRAIDTARYIQNELSIDQEIIVDNRFIERDFASLEGIDVKLVKQITTNKEKLRQYDGYESDENVGKRFNEAIIDLTKKYQNKTILVTSHSHAIKCFLMSLEPTKYNILTVLKNTNVTKIVFDNQKIFIDKFNYFS